MPATLVDTAKLELEMKAWLEDVFGEHADDLTPAELVRAVELHYIGGLRQFIRDGE